MPFPAKKRIQTTDLISFEIPAPEKMPSNKVATQRLRKNLANRKAKCNPATLPVVTVTELGPEALRPQLSMRLPM